MKRYTDIELFAGAGGLALGLERAGFSNIGAVEYDSDAATTLRTNRPGWNVIQKDIAEISGADLEAYFKINRGKLDLLSGGAPCQSFSYAGKRRGLEDTRGTLFYHYALFLQKLQPRFFLFENVKGLTTHDNGNTLSTIKSVFLEQGYTITWAVLNANAYNVPQKRERLFMIGIRNDLQLNYFEWPDEIARKPVLSDVLYDVPASEGAKYSENKETLFKLIPPGGCWVNLPEDLAREYMGKSFYSGGGKRGVLRRQSMNEPGLTVLTSPMQKQTERCHPLENRPFTVRENARIQTFPDDWEFFGNLSSKYKQVGNAVPVNLAYYVGLSIRDALERVKIWNGI